jgi:hypothetical protein
VLEGDYGDATDVFGGFRFRSCQGGTHIVESRGRVERDAFLKRLKEEWGLLWRERFDDRVKAEGVSTRDYPLLMTSRGRVIFASRNAKTPSFPEIVSVWSSKGFVYSPDPSFGGWGRFMRAELRNVVHSRARSFVNSDSKSEKERQHLKKGGRGWLHL